METFALPKIEVVYQTKILIMLKRSARELHLVRGKDPLPTVEIHADSVNEQGLHFGQIVSDALAKFAEQNQTAVATVYSYGTMSVNFHEESWSQFLIVAGNAKLLKALAAAFAHYPKVKSRYSDYIAPSKGRATYHVEDGRLWEVEDAFTWYSADPTREQSGDDAESCTDDEWEDEEEFEAQTGHGHAEEMVSDDDEVEDGDEDEDDDDGSSAPPTIVRRVRVDAARDDAKVSTIRQEIEKAFRLPKGSVALCDPDKTPLKGNALIKTLRRRWEES